MSSQVTCYLSRDAGDGLSRQVKRGKAREGRKVRRFPCQTFIKLLLCVDNMPGLRCDREKVQTRFLPMQGFLPFLGDMRLEETDVYASKRKQTEQRQEAAARSWPCGVLALLQPAVHTVRLRPSKGFRSIAESMHFPFRGCASPGGLNTPETHIRPFRSICTTPSGLCGKRNRGSHCLFL